MPVRNSSRVARSVSSSVSAKRRLVSGHLFPYREEGNPQMPFQGVLGSRGFLDKFAVLFNQYYDYFIVDIPDVADELHRPES